MIWIACGDSMGLIFGYVWIDPITKIILFQQMNL